MATSPATRGNCAKRRQKDPERDQRGGPARRRRPGPPVTKVMSRILSGVVLCGAALHGQVQVQVLAHTQLAVVNQSIPANTDITSGATLQWLVTVPYYSSATMSVAVSPARVSFSNAIVGSPSAVPSIGQHAIRVRLSSTLPTEVTLRAEVYASAS